MDLIFLDLEMTGTDPDKDRILEIGAFICNNDLVVIDTFQSPVYCQSDILAGMNAWCKETHGRTGLLDLVPDAPALWSVELRFMEWLKANEIQPRDGKLVGYSIHFDRAFIRKRLQTLDAYLSHRMIDVSTVRDLAKRWKFATVPNQDMPHRALPDCYVALEELKHYKDSLNDS